MTSRNVTKLTSVVVALLIAAAVQAQAPPPVQVVLFTHIEDNTPGGTLGSAQNRQNYLTWRGRLINVANLMRDADLPWSLQPDWKILRCALLFEDSALVASTNGKNLFRYLKEDLGTVIDAHSHEGGGYNYTDVTHLIDSLGVEPTTVIGGHVWDPALPQFQEWDRYRVPVSGERYPWAVWRGDILMGSGTPNHVNDPVVSGVWRPQDRDHYFSHDYTANIVAIGQYKGTIEALPELAALYASGRVATPFMLTSSYGIRPAMIQRLDGLVSITDSVITPLVAWRESGMLLPTDFTTLVDTWRTAFGSRGYFYDAEAPVTGAGRDAAVATVLESASPNPFAATTRVGFSVGRATRVRLAVYDVFGRELATLVDGTRQPGRYSAAWPAVGVPSGVYFCRLHVSGGSPVQETKLVLIR